MLFIMNEVKFGIFL